MSDAYASLRINEICISLTNSQVTEAVMSLVVSLFVICSMPAMYTNPWVFHIHQFSSKQILHYSLS